jgi:hypothetical protein
MERERWQQGWTRAYHYTKRALDFPVNIQRLESRYVDYQTRPLSSWNGSIASPFPTYWVRSFSLTLGSKHNKVLGITLSTNKCTLSFHIMFVRKGCLGSEAIGCINYIHVCCGSPATKRNRWDRVAFCHQTINCPQYKSHACRNCMRPPKQFAVRFFLMSSEPRDWLPQLPDSVW